MKFLKSLFIIGLFAPLLVFGQKSDKLTADALNQGNIKLAVLQDTIPFEIWYDEILLKMSVNGKSGKFMWDNGFSFCAVTKYFAPGLNLKSLKELKSLAVNDAIKSTVNMDIKLADSMRMGRTEMSNFPVLIVDLDVMLGDNAKDLDGILGAPIVNRLNWKFNFDEHYVVVSEKSFEEKGIVIPFNTNEYNLMYTVFGVNGILGHAEIDFGYNGDDIAIRSEVLPLFEGSKKKISIGQSTSGASGLASVDTTYTIKDFDYIIGDTLTTVPHKFSLTLSKSERDVRIGNRFFRNYNCIINSSTKKIILTPRKEKLTGSPENSFGFVLYKSGDKFEVIVKGDNPNTRKYPELKLQDQIVAINGKKPSDFLGNAALKAYAIQLLDDGKEMKLTRADGKVFILTPQLDIYE